ncbi:GGDEF domain-containing protein [Trinickia dinghuensis]|uniref:diguanylate cyclase n=1 Tax=Trinickia dinghuensis TaxID=2291023 RepID=A0A3D8JUP4_9BURK|nr:GGDEF domain-containing protein [Trinickia dinghuensis]RDU96833.1 GGDEF domain-containing protein [Trinickia dinghuensis]
MTTTTTTVGDPPQAVRRITGWYAALLRTAFALLPAYLIAYLYYFQDPHLLFESHVFHEIAIAAATLEGVFVSYVTWQCYRLSGEPILRWLTLGFSGFVLIYMLHGAFTPLAHHHMWLFLLYGPASRLAMAILLFVGLLSYAAQADAVERRTDRWQWGMWFAAFAVIDLLVAVLSNSSMAGIQVARLLEGAALAISLLNVACLIVRRIRSPLMQIFGISVMAFALSSLAFLLGKPWNHMWWLAHATFAGGFFLLSYGIVQAFHTTRSFSKIYSQEELMAQLRQEMARTESALQELQRSNQKLESLAAVDPMTGVSNRRTFVDRLETEVSSAKRGGAPFSLLAVDLDNLQRVNERFGEQTGDRILRSVAQACTEAMRPYHGIARVGGGEFMAVLPSAALDAALMIGERIRASIQSLQFEGGHEHFSVTASIGIAQFGQDGTTSDAIMRAAGERLKRAKTHGRNCVIAV